MHLSVLFWIVLALCFVRLLAKLFVAARSPLRDIPGPFLSRLSHFWYFKEVATGKFEKTNVDLHKKFGELPQTSVSLQF